MDGKIVDTPVAVAAGVVIHNNNVIIDKNIVKSTVLLMLVWNDIFHKLNITDPKFDINTILKDNKDLLHNLDYNNLVTTLKNYLNKINFRLILN